jgi:hypothetical protein
MAASVYEGQMSESEYPPQSPVAPATVPEWLSGACFDTPVLVTGLPRSGTSMVAGLLGLAGLWLGHTVPGGQENIRGFFENVILRERVQKEILRQGRFDPLGVQQLPPPAWHPLIKSLRAVVGAALAAQQYDGRHIWGFKDAKLTLTWRVWHEHFPRARWVVVRRSSDEIVASCLRTSFMKQHSGDPAFWKQFVADYIERLEALQREVGWSRVVAAGDVAAGRFDALKQLVGDLGLSWQPHAMQAFIAPEHWHAPRQPAT